MAELSDRELDDLVATKILGWVPYPANGEWGWTKPDGTHEFRHNGWGPSTDRHAAGLVLERIAELNLIADFIGVLYSRGASREWDMMTATPRQICEAALKATEDER